MLLAVFDYDNYDCDNNNHRCHENDFTHTVLLSLCSFINLGRMTADVSL